MPFSHLANVYCGVEWAKPQSTVKFMNNVTTDSYYFRATDVEHFGMTWGESVYKHNQAPPNVGNTCT